MSQIAMDRITLALEEVADIAVEALTTMLAPHGFTPATVRGNVLQHEASSVMVAVTRRGYRVSHVVDGEVSYIDEPLSAPLRVIARMATSIAAADEV